jgi:hypothetical protein
MAINDAFVEANRMKSPAENNVSESSAASAAGVFKKSPRKIRLPLAAIFAGLFVLFCFSHGEIFHRPCLVICLLVLSWLNKKQCRQNLVKDQFCKDYAWRFEA